MLVLYNAGFIIAAMDVEPELYEKTQGYLHAVLWLRQHFYYSKLCVVFVKVYL